MDWHNKCANIKVIVTDIDGVLTDGSVGYGCGFDDEIKFFNIKDGTGFRLARYAGLKVTSITGRTSKANRRRLTELGFDVIKEGVLIKGEGIKELCNELNVLPENCMYIGDDIIDLPAFELVGLSVAVADATDIVRERADWVTKLPGGHGAVREVIERLLHEQGTYDMALDMYLKRSKQSTSDKDKGQ